MGSVGRPADLQGFAKEKQVQLRDVGAVDVGFEVHRKRDRGLLVGKVRTKGAAPRSDGDVRMSSLTARAREGSFRPSRRPFRARQAHPEPGLPVACLWPAFRRR